MHHALGAYALAITRDLGWSRTALSGGFSLARFESGLLNFMEDKHQSLMGKIGEAKKLDDESESQLKAAIEEFKDLFKN